jgi:hypothetical protein
MGRQGYPLVVHLWHELHSKHHLFLIGFTAIVDKQLSKRYETLVNKAPELIKVLPWGPDFEVDQFRKPDFTALEVVSFATGGNCLLKHTGDEPSEINGQAYLPALMYFKYSLVIPIY